MSGRTLDIYLFMIFIQDNHGAKLLCFTRASRHSVDYFSFVIHVNKLYKSEERPQKLSYQHNPRVM